MITATFKNQQNNEIEMLYFSNFDNFLAYQNPYCIIHSPRIALNLEKFVGTVEDEFRLIDIWITANINFNNEKEFKYMMNMINSDIANLYLLQKKQQYYD